MNYLTFDRSEFLKCLEKKLSGFRIILFFWNSIYPVLEHMKLGNSGSHLGTPENCVAQLGYKQDSRQFYITGLKRFFTLKNNWTLLHVPSIANSHDV